MTDFAPAQERNLRAALTGCPTVAEAQRTAFGVWSESRGWNAANDGRNTSNSPGVTPAISAILRHSLDMPHDTVGSNGRSVGILQQTPAEVGGAWGDMAGCLTPDVAASRFRARLVVTDDPVYEGWLLTPIGRDWVSVATVSPIVADVLRVQQPLASEARSSNYGPDVLNVALEIVNRFYSPASWWPAWFKQGA